MTDHAVVTNRIDSINPGLSLVRSFLPLDSDVAGKKGVLEDRRHLGMRLSSKGESTLPFRGRQGGEILHARPGGHGGNIVGENRNSGKRGIPGVAAPPRVGEPLGKEGRKREFEEAVRGRSRQLLESNIERRLVGEDLFGMSRGSTETTGNEPGGLVHHHLEGANKALHPPTMGVIPDHRGIGKNSNHHRLDHDPEMTLAQAPNGLSPITYRIHHVWHHEALGAFNSRNEALRYRLNTSKFPPPYAGEGGFHALRSCSCR